MGLRGEISGGDGGRWIGWRLSGRCRRVYSEGAGQHGSPAALCPQDVGVVNGRRHSGVTRVVGQEGRGVGPPGAASTAAAPRTVIHAMNVSGLVAPYLWRKTNLKR